MVEVDPALPRSVLYPTTDVEKREAKLEEDERVIAGHWIASSMSIDLLVDRIYKILYRIDTIVFFIL